MKKATGGPVAGEGNKKNSHGLGAHRGRSVIKMI
jgi:hypothetical protein